MNNKIKILHIITHLPMGGATDNTLYTLELLDKNKYDISLACNFRGEFVNRANSIEKCKILLHLIDCSEKDFIQNYITIRKEIVKS